MTMVYSVKIECCIKIVNSGTILMFRAQIYFTLSLIKTHFNLILRVFTFR
jgi:hypothetical protein